MLYSPVAFVLGAVCSRLLAKPRLNSGDWTTFAATLAALAIVLSFIGVGIWIGLWGNTIDDEPGYLVNVLQIPIFILGLVLGFFWSDLAHLGTLLRNWLAWNF